MAISRKPATYGKRLVLGLLFGLLLAPALQAAWPWVPVKPLNGATVATPAAKFSWSGFWTNSFQPALEASLTEGLGFRPWLVRVRNQLAFSLWHRPLTKNIVIGKDQNLFEQNSINTYLGRAFLGEAEMAKRARHLRRVQDSLRAHGTQFLFVIAPAKARILPQYLPDSCALTTPPRPSNYSEFSQQLRKQGVNMLDGVALFQRWQAAHAPYPLFTRTGTHWSGYGTARVADTLFRRIEQLTGHDLPDFGEQGPPTVVTRAADLRYSDNDLGDVLNMLWEIPPYPTAYPNVVFKPKPGQKKLNALIIGDSFSLSFYSLYPYFPELLTNDSRLWYYNKSVYWPKQTPAGESRYVKDLNLAQQLRGRQLVLIIALEANLDDAGFGFISQAFDVMCPLTTADETRIKAIMDDISHNPGWLASIARGAEEHHIPVEQALRENAKFVFDQGR